MFIVKQRSCSTKPQSTHASHSVPSVDGLQVHPKGIPPRREADLCKGHHVNHHALSLAAAVANCLWRSRNEILVNPPPNITKTQHHHHPPRQMTTRHQHFAADGRAQAISGEMGSGGWKKQFHFANWRIAYRLAAISAGTLYFPTSLYDRPSHSSFH